MECEHLSTSCSRQCTGVEVVDVVVCMDQLVSEVESIKCEDDDINSQVPSVEKDNTSVGQRCPPLKFDPPEKWGLKKQSFIKYKLFVRDMKSIRPAVIFPGAFEYETHLVYRVELAGIVVYVNENKSFYVYGVDDSTGVIKVCQFKNRSPKKYEHGEYVNFVGKLQVFNNEVELFAFTSEVITHDNFEIDRMTEQMKLYKECYFKKLELPLRVQQQLEMFQKGILPLVTTLKSFDIYGLCEKFSQFNVTDLIEDGKLCEKAPGMRISQIKEAITSILEEFEWDGVVYKLPVMSPYEPQYYQFNGGKDCLLKERVKEVLSEDPDDDLGWRNFRIWSQLTQKYDRYELLKEKAVNKCLETLENSNEIYSKAPFFYSIISF